MPFVYFVVNTESLHKLKNFIPIRLFEDFND